MPTFVGVCVLAALVAIALVLGRSPQQAAVPAAVKPNAANATAGGVATVPEGTAQAVQQQGIDLPPKSRLLKLPRAGSEGGESSAMIYSMVCACAKCGSTSFFSSLYKIAFGEDWPYSDKPWLQDLASHRWKGVADVALSDYDMLPQNSFALIRDPKDRLLSAFRSKVTCDVGKGVTRNERKRMVPKLLELAGLLPLERYGLQAPGSEDAGLCLNMTTYMQALGEVWRSGKEAELDAHFLPQTNSCFLNLPPSKWKVVTAIDRPGALCDLESVVRGAVTSRNGTAARDSEDCSFIKRHSTEKGDDATLSEEEEMLLEEITRKEYKVLGPYLQGDGGNVVSDEKETVPEEIIDLSPKSRLLKLPRAGSEGGESSAMIYSMVCACAKCGSTSFFSSLYKIAFGEDWPYSDKPWLQDLASHRWKGVADVALSDYDMLPQNSFALIRDPKDRLLSAFRSKVTCDVGKGVTRNERKRMVPKLLELAGLLPLERYGLQAPGSEDAGLCLNMTTYMQALGEVWRSGKEAELDAHFLPQTNSCFLNLPPSKWKVVTAIDRPGALCDLESVVRGAVTSRNGTAARDSEDCSFIKRHSTEKGDDATLSEEEEMLLEEITRREYEVLGPYL